MKKIFIEKAEKIEKHLVIKGSYKEIAKSIIKNKSGIYALYDKKERLYYIGKAGSNLFNRLNNHLTDKHQNKWKYFSIYLTKKGGYTDSLEDALISIVGRNNLKGNDQKPKKIKDITKEVETAMKAMRNLSDKRKPHRNKRKKHKIKCSQDKRKTQNH